MKATSPPVLAHSFHQSAGSSESHDCANTQVPAHPYAAGTGKHEINRLVDSTPSGSRLRWAESRADPLSASGLDPAPCPDTSRRIEVFLARHRRLGVGANLSMSGRPCTPNDENHRLSPSTEPRTTESGPARKSSNSLVTGGSVLPHDEGAISEPMAALFVRGSVRARNRSASVTYPTGDFLNNQRADPAGGNSPPARKIDCPSGLSRKLKKARAWGSCPVPATIPPDCRIGG